LLQYISLQIRHIDYKLHVYDESYVYMDSIENLNARFDSVPPLKYVPNFSLPKQTIEQQDTVEQSESQSPLTMTQIYYDKDWREISDSEAAVYYRIGTRDSLNRWQGIVHDFFRNGDLQMKGKYSNDLQHGIFIFYSDHHTYSSAGRYENELPVGKWEHFHWNGKMQSEVFYNPGSFTRNVWDSLGNLQVSEGNGEFKRWYSKGRLAEQGNYERGLREGYWYGYHENRKPYYKELYRNNRLINGVSEDKEGRRYVYDGLSQLPVPAAGLADYKKYIDNNKRSLPGEKNKGIVKVLFNVGTDGAMWDFVIFKSVSPACDHEAIRLVREGPAWRAASMHGAEKVLAKGMAEIEF
jgi:antitoxin component YwqK of YwqJK toxin-antitoxin module